MLLASGAMCTLFSGVVVKVNAALHHSDGKKTGSSKLLGLFLICC
jgi:hypothetical protein